jgi:uncharacterized protein YkwD
MKYDSRLLLSVFIVLGGCAPGVRVGAQQGVVPGEAVSARVGYGQVAEGRGGRGHDRRDHPDHGRLERGVIRPGMIERSTLPVGVLRTGPLPAGGRAVAGRFDGASLAELVLREANATRRRNGAGGLRTDPALTRAALRYARELADRREIEHLSATPGRRTFRERIEAEGARARVGGENLARLTASAESLGDRVVDAWLRSPGHRYNLLDPIFARTGVGVWLGGDGVWYVVQVYATGS